MAQQLDQWAAWLLKHRDGGDANVVAQRLPWLYETRDRVLENAAIDAGAVVLDVGAGNGLIGFGALDQVGSAGKVVFSDVSDDLLNECQDIASGLGVTDRCEFVRASADDLHPIRSESVDVVTTRSVLIYLDDLRPAFAEFFRVLRQGGRLSIFEPINRFAYPEPEDQFLGFDARPAVHLVTKVKATADRPNGHPLTRFDERDLFRRAEEAGFQDIHLDYSAYVTRAEPLPTTSWDVLMQMSGNPLDPPLGERVAGALTPTEQSEFEAHFRPLVERGAPRVEHLATAFLRAVT